MRFVSHLSLNNIHSSASSTSGTKLLLVLISNQTHVGWTLPNYPNPTNVGGAFRVVADCSETLPRYQATAPAWPALHGDSSYLLDDNDD